MSQNINIIYKVDSSQVEASTASVNKAKAATDQLTAAAQRFNQQGSRAGNQFSNTIEGVRMKMAQLKSQIDLTNQSDVKRLVQLRSQYASAQKQLESYTGALKKQTVVSKEAAAATGSVSNGFMGLGNVIKGGLILAAVKQLSDATIGALELAGNVDGVGRAFKAQVPNSVALLDNLRKATRGTVTDLDLMQRALKAQNFGIDIQKLPELLEFASIRAQQTGESVDYLVSSIVDGLGRKSLLKLDNLGISASRLKEEFNGASLASLSVAQVTEGVSNIIKEETEKMGGYVETAATKVSQFKTGWENLKAIVSKAIAARIDIIINNKGESLTAKFFNRLGGALKNAGADVRDLIIGQEELIKTEAEARAARLVDAIIEGNEFKSFEDNSEAKIKLLSLELVKQVDLLNARKESIKVIQQQISAQDASTMAGGAQIESLNKLLSAQELGKQTAEGSIDILRKYIVELRKSGEEEEDQLGIIAKKREEIKLLNEQIEQTNKLSDLGAKGKLIVNLDKANKELEELLGNTKKIVVKESNAVSDYLAYLSDLEMWRIKKHLAEEIQAREEAAKEEIRIEKEAQEQREKDAKAHAQRIIDTRNSIVDAANDITRDLTQAAFDAEITEYDLKIDKVKEYYDKQIELAGDNEKAKSLIRRKEEREISELNKKRSAAEKRAALGGILVNTALAIIKALATSATIYDGYVNAAIAAAQGGAQYLIASNARYKDGVIDLKGPGTKTSDSIPALLSRGESVMTANETESSGKTLRMIRAKKLNDKVLDKIMIKANNQGNSIGFDDSRLLKSQERIARAAAGNDIVNKGGIIYEAKEEGKSLKKYIRSKTLN